MEGQEYEQCLKSFVCQTQNTLCYCAVKSSRFVNDILSSSFFKNTLMCIVCECRDSTLPPQIVDDCKSLLKAIQNQDETLEKVLLSRKSKKSMNSKSDQNEVQEIRNTFCNLNHIASRHTWPVLDIPFVKIAVSLAKTARLIEFFRGI